MDYNPYNRNIISKNDSLQIKEEKINTTKNLIFGNSINSSLVQNKNNFNFIPYDQNKRNIIYNRKDNNLTRKSKIKRHKSKRIFKKLFFTK